MKRVLVKCEKNFEGRVDFVPQCIAVMEFRDGCKLYLREEEHTSYIDYMSAETLLSKMFFMEGTAYIHAFGCEWKIFTSILTGNIDGEMLNIEDMIQKQIGKDVCKVIE